MEKSINLATITGDEGVGTIILRADLEIEGELSRYHITAVLPDGTEEDTEVSGAWGKGIESAEEAVYAAWCDGWDLEWIER